MSSTITKTAVVEAPPDKVSAVILDVEAYPHWQREMKTVTVLTKDDTGRPLTAKFAVSAMGQAAGYTLAFSYPAPNVIVTHLTEGDMMTKQDQTYTLTDIGGKTEIEYALDISIKWPVPDFMLNAIINKGVKTNLSGIKAAAEAN
jgi:ribosome-associated toxin RatA of RatAB toxin-antitoxin module